MSDGSPYRTPEPGFSTIRFINDEEREFWERTVIALSAARLTWNFNDVDNCISKTAISRADFIVKARRERM